MLQCCLNGTRALTDHPALPVSPAQIADDVVSLAEVGVRSVHIHPRDLTGKEALAGPRIAPTVARLHSVTPRVGIGVTTAAWIEPDTPRRIDLLTGWAGLAAGKPDFASVNVHEDGWLAACEVLTSARI